MIYGSVCSGIEAATAAWHDMGWRPAWFAEIEPFPCAVLAHRYPEVPNLGDMMTIAARVTAGDVPAPDVLVGGTPCQAFSVAGLRGGLSDPRGALTIAYVQLADAIDAARSVRGERPCITVWENVPGVLSSWDNAFGCFLGALAGEDCELKPPGGKWKDTGCVFGPQRAVAWRVLDAQYFGVAQRRRRVFVIASARTGFNPAEVLFEFEGVRRDSAPSREAGEGAPAGTLRSTDGGSDVDHARAGHIVVGGSVTVMAHGQGGAEIAENRSPTLTFNHEAPIAAYPVCVTGDITHPLKADGFDGSEDGTGRGQPIVAFSCKDHGADAGDLAPTLRAMGHSGSHANAGGQVAVAITEPFTLAIRGRGDSHQLEYRQDGTANALLTPNGGRGGIGVGAVAFHENQRAELTLNDTAGSLKAGGGKPGQGYPAVLNHMQVRRLTPRECERLQGFPDSYTSIPTWTGWRKMDSGETPESCRAEGLEVRQNKKTGKWRVKDVDGPRYKALGNSMAVPCMRWIGRRIEMVAQVLGRGRAA